MLKVLVCGGRDYRNRRRVDEVLDRINEEEPIYMIVHGDARGADTLAKEWAWSRDVIELPYPADWKTNGRAAGPVRNRQMLEQEEPDLVVAFPGGNGTAHMMRIAREAGIKVVDIEDRREGDGN